MDQRAMEHQLILSQLEFERLCHAHNLLPNVKTTNGTGDTVLAMPR